MNASAWAGLSIKNAAALFMRCAIIATTTAACTTLPPPTEVRGTWLTTTANTAIASPANTATTMRRLQEIGLNTVYVETWKDGEAQFPSAVLLRTLSGTPRAPRRDLLQETLIEAHRNGLIYIAWFEYGFMAAHQASMTRLRVQKPTWLSRDINGGEVAPNGFVWMNPLHPEARLLLRDLILEAVVKYDLDGVQIDDRLVWPHVTMGYDDTTLAIYAAEHNGQRPPNDPREPRWMQWRAGKVDEYAKWLVQELRAAKPGLVISLSPAVYPWSWENYLLAWPEWAGWTYQDRLQSLAAQSPASKNIRPHWDEFVPQAYRLSFDAYAKTWQEQIDAVNKFAANRQRDMLAGIRIVGDGADSSWAQLQASIQFARERNNGGHVLWFSQGVLERYSKELTDFYALSGSARTPHFADGWRRAAIALTLAVATSPATGLRQWTSGDVPRGRYRSIGFDGSTWHYLDQTAIAHDGIGGVVLTATASFSRVELIVDRRLEMARALR